MQTLAVKLATMSLHDSELIPSRAEICHVFLKTILLSDNSVAICDEASVVSVCSLEIECCSTANNSTSILS